MTSIVVSIVHNSRTCSSCITPRNSFLIDVKGSKVFVSSSCKGRSINFWWTEHVTQLTVLNAGFSDKSSAFRALKLENIPVDNSSRLQLRSDNSSRDGKLNRDCSGRERVLLSNVNLRRLRSPANVSGSMTPVNLLTAKLMEVRRGRLSTVDWIRGRRWAINLVTLLYII